MKTRIALVLGSALAACLIGSDSAQAGHRDPVGVWYGKYLHRPVDRHGLNNWSRVLQCDGPVAVQAGILGSDEYYRAHGNCPRTFVVALYQDVLGRTPCAAEVEPWVCELGKCGCRVTLARSFLTAAQEELNGCHTHREQRSYRWGR